MESEWPGESPASRTPSEPGQDQLCRLDGQELLGSGQADPERREVS